MTTTITPDAARARVARIVTAYTAAQGALVELSDAIHDAAATREHDDAICGCGWQGLNSHRATTTATVADIDITFDDYVTAIESSLSTAGWATVADSAADLAEWMTDLADDYPVGTVLGHFLREPHVRAEPAAA
jgi:hypothetical protein